MELEAQAKLFKRGMTLFRRGALDDAALIFRQLVESGSVMPLHLSYCGLLTATVHGRKREGRELCERAMDLGTDEPEVVSNLAGLYQRNGEKQRAIRVLRRGLRATPKHPTLLAQIQRISPRQDPPLRMMDRDNPVNKALAIGLARMSGRYDASKKPSEQADADKPVLRKLRTARQS